MPLQQAPLPTSVVQEEGVIASCYGIASDEVFQALQDARDAYTAETDDGTEFVLIEVYDTHVRVRDGVALGEVWTLIGNPDAIEEFITDSFTEFDRK